jgi:chromosome segregation ATPase
MSSELELMKQRITELEAENVEIAELRKENAELRKENTDFRMKFANFEAERAELKRRIAETLRMTEEERTRRDAENVKLRATIEELKSENIEVRDRLTKVEQNQLQNNNSSNNNSSNFNSVAVPEAITVPTNSAKRLNGKLLEEKDMDSFLLEAHIKMGNGPERPRSYRSYTLKRRTGSSQCRTAVFRSFSHVTKDRQDHRSL